MNAADVFKSVGPQAEALAKLTGLDPESVRLLLAILIAALIEMGSGLGFWLMSTEAASPHFSRGCGASGPVTV